MSQLPKWTEERTQALVEAVENIAQPIPVAAVEELAAYLETTTRSIGSKLRKMGYEVQPAAENKRAKTFSDEQEEALRELVTSNSGDFTFEEIANKFEGGAFTRKQVQGKLLSMELTGHVKPTPKAEVARTYTPKEEVRIAELWNAGAYIEDIAEALGKSITSIRGKCLSMRTDENVPDSLPKQRDKAPVSSSPYDKLEELNLAEYTVEQLAEMLEKTVRGVKSVLTRRGLTCADHDGAAKAAKAKEAQAV